MSDTAFIDTLVARMPSQAWKLAAILFVALLVYLFGNDRTALFDRDEPRYAQCSRQMLQSGDWVVPRLYDKLRAAKGPGIYWCQATAMALLGDTQFAARLPSALASVFTALLMGLVVWKKSGPDHAVWTVFILVTSALMIWSSKICLTDAVQLLFITISLLCIYLLWQRQLQWLAVIGLSVSIACAGLIKGPFILGVIGGTLLCLFVLSSPLSLRSELRSPAQMPSLAAISFVILKILLGLLIVAAMAIPWLYLVRQRAPEFLGAASADLRQHLEKGSEGHTAPPGYHLLFIWMTWMPWSLLLPLSIVLGWKNRKAPEIRFALATVLGTWIFVEVLQTKLPHYIIPAFPALAFLTADAVVRNIRGQQHDLAKFDMRIAAVVLAIVVAAVCTIPFWMLSAHYHDFPWLSLLTLTIGGALVGLAVATLFILRRPIAGLVAMGCGSLLLAAVLFGIYLPTAQPLRVPIRVAEVLKSNGAVHPHEALMLDYKEPSLAFYQGGTIREYDYSLEKVATDSQAARWVVTSRTIWDHTPAAVRDCFELVGESIVGLNYSDAMKNVEVVVVRRK